MDSFDVVVAHHDRKAAEQLAAGLRPIARSIAIAASAEELQSTAAKHRADLAVVDLETVPLNAVEALQREFRHLSIVCTHRLPDEAMWTAALNAGAIDCCHSSDANGILLAARRNSALARGNAA